MEQYLLGWIFWAFIASILTMIISKEKLDEKHFVYWVLSPIIFVIFLIFGIIKKQPKQAMKLFYKTLFPN